MVHYNNDNVRPLYSYIRLGSPAHSAGDLSSLAQESGEEQYISFCFQNIYPGANPRVGFSPWSAIG